MTTKIDSLPRWWRRNKIAVAVCLGLAVFSGMPGRAWAGNGGGEPGLEQRIIAYCQSHLGQKVGNGQCAGLAAQALKEAGARTRGGPDSPEPGDYVWGREVAFVEAGPDGVKITGDLSDVRPGDIVQYRNTRFLKAHYAHHTSIVREVNGNSLKVYQQHVNKTEIVEEGAVRLDKLEGGWLRIYRPLPKT